MKKFIQLCELIFVWLPVKIGVADIRQITYFALVTKPTNDNRVIKLVISILSSFDRVTLFKYEKNRTGSQQTTQSRSLR